MAVNVDALNAAQARGWTTGLVPPPGTPPPLRLEIDDFLLDTELANLYFLAMASYMGEEAARSPFSYFEISGIHGQPNRPWDGQPQSSEWVPNTPNGDARKYSYCAHSSLVFPTWHRAYLAQFEQGLYVHAAAFAPALRAEKVLERFRIPYFDPLLPRQTAGQHQIIYGIPIIFTLPKIRVKRTADGPWAPMDNPLYSYRFSNATRTQMDFSSWGNLRNPSQLTMRAYDFQRDQPNHEVLMRAFDNLYNPSINLSTQAFDNLYRVMTDEKQTWETMSNSGRSADLGMNSLEGFHDNLHVQISWGLPGKVDSSPRGHMSDPDFAAFDPSFWLHHCNVDRLLAIWQGLKSEAPESVRWWAANDRPFNDENDTQPASFWARTPDSDLVPFVRTQAGGREVYWNSNDLREHRALGYDYPETAAAGRQTRESYVDALRRWANTELGWLGRINTGGDPAAITRLNDSITKSIPFFPKEIFIDGDRSRPLGNNQAFIGSKFAGIPTTGPGLSPTPVTAAPMEAQFAGMSISPGAGSPSKAAYGNQYLSSTPVPPQTEWAQPPCQSTPYQQYSAQPPYQHFEPYPGQQFQRPPYQPSPCQEFGQPPGQQFTPPPYQQVRPPPCQPVPCQQFQPPPCLPPKEKHSHGLSGMASKLAAKVASVTGDRPESGVPPSSYYATTPPPCSPSPPAKDRYGISSMASKFGNKAVSVASQKMKDAAASIPQTKIPDISVFTTKVQCGFQNAVGEFQGGVQQAFKQAHDILNEKVLDRAISFVDLSFQTRFGHLMDLLSDRSITQWNVTYTVDKFCLDGSFVVNFFLGDFCQHPGQWALDEHLAGQSAVFASNRARRSEGGCDSCRQQEQEGMVYGDTVGLTEALLVYYGTQEEARGHRIMNLKPEVVVPFLQKNLHWRIESARGGHVPRQSVPSLKVGVFSEVLRLPDSMTELPRYVERILHHEVTAGRPNGLNHGEGFY